jgi:hypothetical protein
MATTDDHATIAAFSARLPIRADAERVRAVLAVAFADHVGDLWPDGDAAATPAWLAENVDGVLATIERLYAVAANGDDPGAGEFVDRLAWLPPLLAELDRPRRLDA